VLFSGPDLGLSSVLVHQKCRFWKIALLTNPDLTPRWGHRAPPGRCIDGGMRDYHLNQTYLDLNDGIVQLDDESMSLFNDCCQSL